MELDSNSNLERSDTLPIFNEDIYSSLVHNTSFNEKFSSNDLFNLMEEPTTTSQNIEPKPKQLIREGSSWRELRDQVFLASTSNDDTSAVVNPNIVSGHKVTYQVDGKNILINNYLKYEENLEETSVLFVDANKEFINEGIPSLSFVQLSGPLQFALHLDSNKHNTNKWCYSKTLDKLFVQSSVAVPVKVTVNHWMNSYVNITPVFVESQCQALPVGRCYAHQKADESKNLPYADHIVQVDNSEARYKCLNNRHSVDIPLGTPAVGVNSKTLYVKCGCWNTCTGGPDRRRFALVFTLFSQEHEEIGRQILNLKVCSCPKRDMELEENKESGAPSRVKLVATKRLKLNKKMVKKIKSEIVQPNQQPQVYEQINVPVELAPYVKKCVNLFFVEKMLKQNPETNSQLPFPNF